MQLIENFLGCLEFFALDYSLLTTLHFASEGGALVRVGLRGVAAKRRIVLHPHAADLAGHRAFRLLWRLGLSGG